MAEGEGGRKRGRSVEEEQTERWRRERKVEEGRGRRRKEGREGRKEGRNEGKGRLGACRVRDGLEGGRRREGEGERRPLIPSTVGESSQQSIFQHKGFRSKLLTEEM